MSRKSLSRLGLIAGLVLFAGLPAHAQKFQTFKDCEVGKRVHTNDGRKGTITRLDTAWSYCYVKFDDDGKEISMLYSLLNGEGGVAPKDLKLATGIYECAAGGQIGAGNIRITGANTYSFGNDGSGKFHVETSGKIVFESGPLMKESSKVLSEGRIGLSGTDKNFFPIACALNRNLH